ncbi:MAG TPA: vitamin K epoxide reductase family protein, partial [Tepidisphaeraceae bacterium]|nr:vitamin K epoxide reductase family protein [Tepidisphaeraceae bacterium]
GSGCDTVLSSRFSRVGTIPVSALALPIFLMMGICAVAAFSDNPRRGELSRQMLPGLAIIASGAAIWFIVVQAFVLHRFCVYCTMTHVLALAASVLIFWQWLTSETKTKPLIPAIAALLLAAMIASQLLIQPTLYTITTDTQPSSQPSMSPASNQISLYNNRITVDPSNWPVFGSRRAEHRVILLFDYTCSHCRREYPLLQQARQRYGTQIAFIVIPLPLEPSCNSAIPRVIPEHINSCTYTRYALAVFLANPDQFEQFHNRIMEGDRPPSLQQTRQIAEELISPGAFAAALADPSVEKHIQESVQLYRAVGAGPIPKLILPAAVIHGEIYPLQHMFDILESHLNVKPLR